MKRLSIFVMLAIAATFVTPTPAQSQIQKTGIEILPCPEGYLRLIYVNPFEKNIKVRILNENGSVHSEKIRLSDTDLGFGRRYNLKFMDPGTYWVEVSNSSTLVRYEFTYSEDLLVTAKYWDSRGPFVDPAIVASLK